MCKSRHDFYNENNKRFIEEWRNDRATVYISLSLAGYIYFVSDNSHTFWRALKDTLARRYIYIEIGINAKSLCNADIKRGFLRSVQLCNFRPVCRGSKQTDVIELRSAMQQLLRNELLDCARWENAIKWTHFSVMTLQKAISQFDSSDYFMESSCI
jgi:hypothetical protein